MNRKYLLLILLILWFILSGFLVKYLIDKEYLSTDMSNTYVVFPNGGEYNAPTGYMEYYLGQEGGGMNKYTSNHMIDFPKGIDLSGN